MPSEKTPERKPVAKTDIGSSVNETEAIVSAEENEDLLHRFVSYGSFLGIVKDVFYTRAYEWGQKRISIKNLVKLDKGSVMPVRDAPAPNLEVFLASTADLEAFFPVEGFPKNGYAIRLSDVRYP